MGSHVDGLYLDLRTICRSADCRFSLRVCNEADVSTQERGDPKDTGTKLNGEGDEVERKTAEIRRDRLL